MTRQQIFVSTLKKAIRANFATTVGLKSSNAFEETTTCSVAMYYGIIADTYGDDVARDFAFISGVYDYDDLIKEYAYLLNLKQKSRTGGNWFRYQNKKSLILRYFKYGKK